MDTTHFLLISAAVTSGALLAALGLRRPQPPADPPREATRWKRLRIFPGALHGVLREAAAVAAEEPSGLKLAAAPREDASPRRLRILGSDSRTVIELVRGVFLFRRRLRVILQGKDWLHVMLPRPGEKKPELRFASPTDACDLQGNVTGREFEIRKRGRLVASVSWQQADGDAAPRRGYVLEALKTEEPLPVLALVLAIEAVMGPPK